MKKESDRKKNVILNLFISFTASLYQLLLQTKLQLHLLIIKTIKICTNFGCFLTFDIFEKSIEIISTLPDISN